MEKLKIGMLKPFAAAECWQCLHSFREFKILLSDKPYLLARRPTGLHIFAALRAIHIFWKHCENETRNDYIYQNQGFEIVKKYEDRTQTCF